MNHFSLNKNESILYARENLRHDLGKLSYSDYLSKDCFRIVASYYIIKQLKNNYFYKGSRVAVQFHSIEDLNEFCINCFALIIDYKPFLNVDDELVYFSTLEFFENMEVLE